MTKRLLIAISYSMIIGLFIPVSYLTHLNCFSGSARLLAATTLRNVLGTMTLGEILSAREKIATEMKVEQES